MGQVQENRQQLSWFQSNQPELRWLQGSGHSHKIQGLQGCEVANGVCQLVQLFAPPAQEKGQWWVNRLL